jgi:hypothetical protein
MFLKRTILQVGELPVPRVRLSIELRNFRMSGKGKETGKNGDSREVCLVLLSGTFVFQRRGQKKEVDHVQFEVDAVEGSADSDCSNSCMKFTSWMNFVNSIMYYHGNTPQCKAMTINLSALFTENLYKDHHNTHSKR